MNVNYDKLFEEKRLQCSGGKLLLHVCCAPCATYCLTRLLNDFDVTLYYSNDNITDFSEWQKRLDELKKLVRLVNDGFFETQPEFPLKLAVKDFDSARFFEKAKGLESEKEGGARCTQCFFMRLYDTFCYAQEHNYELFGTTLTVSPYKNSRLLNEIGMDISEKGAPQWLPSDFKKRGGYAESIRLCAEYGIYRQHYCGCVFSNPEAQTK